MHFLSNLGIQEILIIALLVGSLLGLKGMSRAAKTGLKMVLEVRKVFSDLLKDFGGFSFRDSNKNNKPKG